MKPFFDLASGWNWIGYTPQMTWDLNTALYNIPDGNAIYIKSQTGFSDYYSSFGWYGTLEELDPFSGYIMNNSMATSFTYNEGDDGVASQGSEHIYSKQTDVFDLNIHDYEYNGSMTVALYNNNDRIDTDDYMLAAFDGNQCVGYTQGMVFPLDGNMIFPLMVYGNENNRGLTFKGYEQSTGNYYDIKEQLAFTEDMRLGNGFEPVTMTMTDEQPGVYSVGSPYPNPFNPVVNVDVELSSESYIQAKVYNISGQEITTLHEGMLSGKTHKLTWMADGQSSGIYFIRVMVDNQPAINKKIILLK